MRHVTPVVLPQSTPFVHRPVEAMLEAQLVLEEVGALYPVVAYWNDESNSADETAPKAQMDGEALDKVIFAGMVGLH
jgi:hypothetical protein